jgi:ATP-dependent helicase/nuclease subunit B
MAVKPVARPAPTPPIDARPRSLSVTKIEKWLNDPYSIYAQYILRLKRLPDLEQPVDAAIKGTLLHEIMNKFVHMHPNDMPSHALDDFLTVAASELGAYADDPALWSFWKPRLTRLGGWITDHERSWRQDWRHAKAEVAGKTLFDGPAGAFTLTAIADRIDTSLNSSAGAIIDYKSGGTFSQSGMKSGRFPQLPLEALILANGGFEGLKAMEPAILAYWVLTGGREPGKVTPLEKDVQVAIDAAKDGLTGLIAAFDNPDTPYYSLPDPARAPRFNDYEHLARVKEWAALDEAEEAA